MWFELFLDLQNLKYYGYIPEMPEDRAGRVEIYKFDSKTYRDLINKDFVDSVNAACDSLLDISDVDFFDSEKCVKLKSWLENRLAKDIDPLLFSLYGKLLEFANKAIELNTGVVIQL